MDNITPMPLWKKNATPEERMLEVAHMAREHPERFSKIALIYQEDINGGASSVVRYACYGVTTTELIGLIECGKIEVMKVCGTIPGE